LETRDLGASLAIEFTDVLARVDEITAINFVSQESHMSLINARKNRVHRPESEVHHSPQFFLFKAALFISTCLQILRENNAKDRIRSWKTYVYTTSFDGPKTTF